MKEFIKTEQIVKLLLIEKERALTEKEQLILNNWLKEDEGNQILYNRLKNEANISEKLKSLSEFDKDEAFARFVELTKNHKTRNIYREVLKYAAILIPFIFAVWFIFQNNNKIEPEINIASTKIQPGTSKAILKLSDGTIVNLEDEKELVAEFDGTTISNTNKEIIYNPSGKKVKFRKLQYNTIEIPRGGEYQLILSDGTKVWLNSATTIKYPITFAANSRDVYLEEGEAFFEVTENKKSPFIVHTSKMNVNVLGTSFNVRAYSAENQLATTLVTGKVLINQSKNGKEYTLIPNEQAILSDEEIDIVSVDVDRFIAWKNGRILFEENTLEEIFNDLSRWYNIDVDYTSSEVKNLRFSVDVKRYDELVEILDILELTKKVKFIIEENSVTIQ
jgi:transmembrane sensor